MFRFPNLASACHSPRNRVGDAHGGTVSQIISTLQLPPAALDGDHGQEECQRVLLVLQKTLTSGSQDCKSLLALKGTEAKRALVIIQAVFGRFNSGENFLI